jgi:hypothetical protein
MELQKFIQKVLGLNGTPRESMAKLTANIICAYNQGHNRAKRRQVMQTMKVKIPYKVKLLGLGALITAGSLLNSCVKECKNCREDQKCENGKCVDITPTTPVVPPIVDPGDTIVPPPPMQIHETDYEFGIAVSKWPVEQIKASSDSANVSKVNLVPLDEFGRVSAHNMHVFVVKLQEVCDYSNKISGNNNEIRTKNVTDEDSLAFVLMKFRPVRTW